jgi:hypothetical protein
MRSVGSGLIQIMSRIEIKGGAVNLIRPACD